MNNETRTYPYTAWVLKPSFKPALIEFVRPYDNWGVKNYGDVCATGKVYRISEIHATKEQAIECGRVALATQQTKLTRMQAALDKRFGEIAKAQS